jgi:chromosome segregation ATPase
MSNLKQSFDNYTSDLEQRCSRAEENLEHARRVLLEIKSLKKETSAEHQKHSQEQSQVIASLRKELLEYQKTTDTLQLSIQNEKERLQAKEDEVITLSNNLKEMCSKEEKLRTLVKSQLYQYEQETDKLKHKEKEINDYKEQLIQAQKLNEMINEKLENQIKQYEEETDTYKDKERELMSLLDEEKDELKRKNAEVLKLGKRLKELSFNEERLRKESQSHFERYEQEMEKVEQKESQLNRLKDELSEVFKEQEKLRERSLKYDAEMEKWKQKEIDMKKAISEDRNYEIMLQKMKVNLEEAKKSIAQKDSEILRLTESINNIQLDPKDLEEKLHIRIHGPREEDKFDSQKGYGFLYNELKRNDTQNRSMLTMSVDKVDSIFEAVKSISSLLQQTIRQFEKHDMGNGSLVLEITEKLQRENTKLLRQLETNRPSGNDTQFEHRLNSMLSELKSELRTIQERNQDQEYQMKKLFENIFDLKLKREASSAPETFPMQDITNTLILSLKELFAKKEPQTQEPPALDSLLNTERQRYTVLLHRNHELKLEYAELEQRLHHLKEQYQGQGRSHEIQLKNAELVSAMLREKLHKQKVDFKEERTKWEQKLKKAETKYRLLLEKVGYQLGKLSEERMMLDDQIHILLNQAKKKRHKKSESLQC